MEEIADEARRSWCFNPNPKANLDQLPMVTNEKKEKMIAKYNEL